MKKKRGSILIYIMAIFAVLMIMGATLTALTLQSMKNRKYYSNKRVNLYYSESGIDEAYGVATEYVKSASNDAINKTNMDIESIISQDKKYLEDIFYMRDTLNYTEEKIDSEIEVKELTLQLFTKYGVINEEKLKKKQDDFFKKYYIEFFTLDQDLDGEVDDNINNLIIDLENNVYSDTSGGTIEAKVTDYDVAISKEFNITMNIKSIFKSEGIEKIVSANLIFTLPTYGSKVSFPTKYTSFPESPIWNNGITVNKTLSIGEANQEDNHEPTLQVTGDVYVKGEEKVAILMNSKKSILTVDNGKVIACEGVKFDYDSEVAKSKGAKININDGSLYTKGILFNKESKGAGLHVKDSIYVLDDCEINAKKSTLDVEGSYYGVSNGVDSVDNKVDNSSSIIINSEDLGGNKSDEKGSTISIGGKVYLAGTSYIKGLNNPVSNRDYDYQTGESISIKGNYKSYSERLESNLLINNRKLGTVDLKYELEKNMLSPLVLATHYNKYSKWFTIYDEDNEIYFGMDNQLKEKYEEVNWENLYRINITGLENKEFEIGKRVGLDSSEIQLIKNAIKNTNNNTKELNIQLVKDAEGVINLIKDIDVPILQEDFEAFLHVDDSNQKNIFITMTPKGEIESSLNGASYVEVKGGHGGLNEFIEVTEAAEGENVSVTVKNRGETKLFEQGIELLRYSSYFQNFSVIDKSAYFKQFYEDYKNKDIIQEGKGITIGQIGESIYRGAIVSEAGAESTNYGGTHNNYRVGQKKAELKDKLLYMDMFEKKHFHGNKDTKYLNELSDFIDLSDFNVNEYIALLGAADKNHTKKPPEHDREYKITPESLLDFEKINQDVDSLDTGVYISIADKTVLTNKRNSPLQGTKVILNNNSFGIIICKEDVFIEGDFMFTGTIIALGDVYVVDGSNVKIYYDDTLVKRVVAMNYDKLKEVFVNLEGYELDTIKMEVYNNNKRTSTSVPLTIEKWVVVK